MADARRATSPLLAVCRVDWWSAGRSVGVLMLRQTLITAAVAAIIAIIWWPNPFTALIAGLVFAFPLGVTFAVLMCREGFRRRDKSVTRIFTDG